MCAARHVVVLALEESDLQVTDSAGDGSLRCDLQAHLSKLAHDKGAHPRVLSPHLGKGCAPEVAPPSSKAESSRDSSSGSLSDSSSDSGAPVPAESINEGVMSAEPCRVNAGRAVLEQACSQSGSLPSAKSPPFVQLQDLTALCAVRRVHSAIFRPLLAAKLHEKLEDGRSHGYSLSPHEVKMANILRRLNQPMQPWQEGGAKITRDDKDDAAGKEVSGSFSEPLPLHSVFLDKGKDLGQSSQEYDGFPDQAVYDCALSSTLPMCSVEMQAPKIKSGLPPSLQKLEEARIADVHEGASSFKSLLAHW